MFPVFSIDSLFVCLWTKEKCSNKNGHGQYEAFANKLHSCTLLIVGGGFFYFLLMCLSTSPIFLYLNYRKLVIDSQCEVHLYKV